jgi:lysozyme
MSTTDPVSGTSSTSGNVPARRSLSAEGLNFIERHEGYRGKIYPDSAGNPTIGYGHLIRSGEDFSSGITRAQALQLLTQDTSTAVDSVNNKVKTNLGNNIVD